LKKSHALLVAAFVFLPSAALAARVDLNTIKCKEWLESGKDDITYTMAWLDGYYKSEDDSPVIDFDKMKVNAEKLAKYCTANPDLGLGTSAEKLFGNGK